jgi:Ca-activated chloride channel family protein
LKASVKFEHELLAVESDHRLHAMLELTAPKSKETDRRPLHIALVIDRSGSMAGAKLDYTKAASRYLIEKMSPTDLVALIAYDSEVTLLAPLEKIDKPHLAAALSSIFARASTNLSGGWLKGLEELGRAPQGGISKVLLLSDGLANEGITDPDALVQMAREAAHSGSGTTTIGFGADFDEKLLTDMAEAGRGNSYYVASPEDAPGVFAQEFEGLVELVAQNVSVEIRPREEVEVLGILNDYPAARVPGGVQLQLGDAYSEESRRVVLELHIPELAGLGLTKVADVVLRYVTVGDEVAAHEVTIPVHVNLVVADEAAGSTPNSEVVEEITILKSVRAQRDARKRADSGDFDGAQLLLRGAAEDLRRQVPGSARANELLAEAAVLESHAEIAKAASWDAHSSKSIHYSSWERRQSRRRPKSES